MSFDPKLKIEKKLFSFQNVAPLRPGVMNYSG